MKTVLILLALGYASSDKLDLSYLPPPGSQYAGGRPGDLQIPLEFPKETYSTTFKPQVGDNRGLSPDDYKATIGIDRVPGVQNIGTVSPGPSSSSTFQNSQRVPTTTVSYAFTQTTTHPTTEGFETTIGPQVTGEYPTTDIFNNAPSQESGLINQGNFITQNRPGYQQTVNQFGRRPTQAPTTGQAFYTPSQQPGLNYEGNLNAQRRPGYKEVINQFGQPTLVPASGPETHFTGSSSLVPEQHLLQQNRPSQTQINNQFRPGQQNPVLENIPGVTPTQQPFGENQFRNQSISENLGVNGRPGYAPSTVAPQVFPSTSQPTSIVPFGDNFSNVPGFVTNIPQGNYPGQQIDGFQPSISGQPNQIPIGQQQFGDRQIVNQQFTGSQTPTQFGGVGNTPIVPSATLTPTVTPGRTNQQFPGTSIGSNRAGPQNYPGLQGFRGVTADKQNAFLPTSTAASTFVTPGAVSQGFPTGTSVSLGDQQYPPSIAPGSYPTPTYPGAQTNAAASVYRNRPERPQAEADRNAVILTYENEIGPDGYAYSFDTSNGIHADESGTATDGVKAQGSYSYTGDDGKIYSVVYTADEDGFRPRGDHLPTPPPIPEAIQRVIELAEKEKEAGISDDGSYDEDKYGHKKYQGAIGSHQPSNKMISNTDYTDIAEDDLTVEKEQRFRPQAGKKKLTVSDDNTEYDEDISELGLDKDELDEQIDDRRKISHPSPQSPNRVINAGNKADKDATLEVDLDQDQPLYKRPTNQRFVEVTSKRLGNQSIRKQYNKIKTPSSEENVIGKTRRPVGKKPINQAIVEDQDSDEYTERPKYIIDRNKNRYVNKATVRPRPGYEEGENQYENEDTTASDNYDEVNSSTRPSSTLGPFRRPGTNVATENEDNVNLQAFDKYGRPVQEKKKDKFKQRIGTKMPLKKPSAYSPNESQTITEDYDFDEDNVTKRPSKFRPVGENIPNQFTSRDESVPIGVRRRPTKPGLQMVTPDKNIKYQPDNGEEYIDSEIDDGQHAQEYDNKRPPNASSQEDQLDKIDEVFEDYEPSNRDYSSTPKVSSTKKYSDGRGRPHINVNDEGTQELGNKRINAARPGTKFGQKIIRPGFQQQTDLIENNVYNNHPFNGSGYQYIPPIKKFDHHEVNVLPNRFKGTTRRPFIEKQTPNVYYENKIIPSKPFMTPNASPIHKPDEHDHGLISSKPETKLGQQGNRFDEETFSQYPVDGTTTDEVLGGDAIYSTGPVNQYSSTTRRPIQQYSTGRPQYTQKGSGFTDGRVTQTERPAQGIYETTQTPFGIISSTTPVPSRIYGSTNAPTRSGQLNRTYYTSDGSHKNIPGQVSISSTTPFASQSSTIDDGSYQEGNRFQTTYRPGHETTRPIPDYEDSTTTHRFPTEDTTDAEVTITPGVTEDRYQVNIPSTTYRPNIVSTGHNQPSSTAKPDVLVDRYGRPVIKISGSDTTGENFLPGNNQVISTVRPVVDVYGRPIKPVSVASLQGLPGDQNVPSYTAIPEIVVDAFGRPTVRPQSVPGSRQELSSTVKPELQVDAFGRPIETSKSPITNIEYIGGGLPTTVRPGGLVDAFGRPIPNPETDIQGYLPGQSRPSSIVRPGITIDAYGQKILSPGSTPQPFPSSYPTAPGVVEHGRLGVPGIGDQGQNQPSSSSPSLFRGNQKYQPGLTQPGLNQGTSPTFRPSTERVIGEDFSGPKQQQRFDPKRGYYYK